MPDLGELEGILESNKRIKMIWVNYPNNPTTAMANETFFRGLVDLSRRHGVIIASDEAYTEMYVREKPHSVLEYANDWSNIIALHSLSKRSNATGIRLGFAAGGSEAVTYFRKLRTQIDSGVANAVQEAGIAALHDETHVQGMRELYERKRRILTGALESVGIRYWADSTFYIWANVGSKSTEFAKKLLNIDREGKVGINITPGSMLAIGNAPSAESYVRFALVPSIEDTELAATIIREHVSEMVPEEPRVTSA